MHRVLPLLFCSTVLAAPSLAVQPPPSSSRATDAAQAADRTAKPRVRLLAEGTFVVQRTGTIRPGSDGALEGWTFEFDQPESGRPIPSMKVIPSANLGAFVRSIRPSADGHRVTLSGRVLAYRGANYLLLTAPPRLIALASPSPSDESPRNTPPPESTGPFDPSRTIDTLKKDDGSSALSPPREQPDSAAAPSGATKRASSLRAEGTMIINRAARCTLDGSGRAQVLSFEADSDGLQDPPMGVVPCRLLERLENQARQRGDAMRLIISGQIISADSSPSILITSFRIPYDRDNLSPAAGGSLSGADDSKPADH